MCRSHGLGRHTSRRSNALQLSGSFLSHSFTHRSAKSASSTEQSWRSPNQPQEHSFEGTRCLSINMYKYSLNFFFSPTFLYTSIQDSYEITTTATRIPCTTTPSIDDDFASRPSLANYYSQTDTSRCVIIRLVLCTHHHNHSQPGEDSSRPLANSSSQEPFSIIHISEREREV